MVLRRNSRIVSGLFAALGLAASACSLIVENKVDQCQTDADCAHFGDHPACHSGVCVASGLGPPGCLFGDAGTPDEYQNGCTTSQCLKFDNCARLNLCGGAALPALIDPPKTP